MHRNLDEREVAMPNVTSLLALDGVLIMSLRHGPVPAERRMFEVSAEETVWLAQRCGLREVLNIRTESVQPANRQAGVTWTRLAFVRCAHQRAAGDRREDAVHAERRRRP